MYFHLISSPDPKLNPRCCLVLLMELFFELSFQFLLFNRVIHFREFVWWCFAARQRSLSNLQLINNELNINIKLSHTIIKGSLPIFIFCSFKCLLDEMSGHFYALYTLNETFFLQVWYFILLPAHEKQPAHEKHLKKCLQSKFCMTQLPKSEYTEH